MASIPKAFLSDAKRLKHLVVDLNAEFAQRLFEEAQVEQLAEIAWEKRRQLEQDFDPQDQQALIAAYESTPERIQIAAIRSRHHATACKAVSAFSEASRVFATLAVAIPSAQRALVAIQDFRTVSGPVPAIEARLGHAKRETESLYHLVDFIEGELHGSSPRKSLRPDDNVKIKELIRRCVKEGRGSAQEICAFLSNSPRPRGVAWEHLSWPVALQQHKNSVSKWISNAKRTRQG